MTRRPADWSPLAQTDPVPGDPQEVAALGRRFEATAAEIAAAWAAGSARAASSWACARAAA